MLHFMYSLAEPRFNTCVLFVGALGMLQQRAATAAAAAAFKTERGEGSLADTQLSTRQSML